MWIKLTPRNEANPCSSVKIWIFCFILLFNLVRHRIKLIWYQWLSNVGIHLWQPYGYTYMTLLDLAFIRNGIVESSQLNKNYNKLFLPFCLEFIWLSLFAQWSICLPASFKSWKRIHLLRHSVYYLIEKHKNVGRAHNKYWEREVCFWESSGLI